MIMLKYIDYKVRGGEGVTPCPFGTGRMVGMLECRACERNFMTLDNYVSCVCGGTARSYNEQIRKEYEKAV